MKKSFIIGIIVGITIGFFIGLYINKSSKEKSNIKVLNDSYNEAYKKGWVYWFSGYGSHGEGTQYVNLYTYGRKYNTTFENEHDAFVSGYKDGFYYVNRKETTGDKAEEGYNQYYPGTLDTNSMKAISSIMISVKDTKDNYVFNDYTNTYLGIIRSYEFRKYFVSKYGNNINLIDDFTVSSINESNSIYKLSLNCKKIDADKCKDELEYINNELIDRIRDLYNYNVSVVDKTIISK